MADTTRTLAEILALLADNETQDISPQDHRDQVVSMFANYAQIGIGITPGTTAQTTNATPGTLDTITGFTTNGNESGCLTADQANNRIIASVDGAYLLIFQCSFNGTNSAEMFSNFQVDGVTTPLGVWRRKLGTGGDVGAASSVGIANALAGDAITVTIGSDGASDDFTPEHMTLTAIKIG